VLEVRYVLSNLPSSQYKCRNEI